MFNLVVYLFIHLSSNHYFPSAYFVPANVQVIGNIIGIVLTFISIVLMIYKRE